MSKIFLIEGNELVHYSEGKKEKFPLNKGSIVGNVCLTNTLEEISNGYGNPYYNGLIDLDTAMPLICMPIRFKNEIIGAFEVINSKGIENLGVGLKKAKLSLRDSEKLEFFSEQLAQIIINTQHLKKIESSTKINE